MGAKRKSHPDYYQTQPTPPHENELQKSEYRKLKSGGAPPGRRGQERAGKHEIRVGEHLNQPATLRCERCGAEAEVLAGESVTPCETCRGEVFHLSV